MHAMLLSTSYNSLPTVLANLHHAFSEVAQKTYHYIKALPPGKQPAGKLINSTYPESFLLLQEKHNMADNVVHIGTVEDLIKLSCILMRRRRGNKKAEILPFECCVSDGQARW
jgi:telomerase reverse transcriptase